MTSIINLPTIRVDFFLCLLSRPLLLAIHNRDIVRARYPRCLPSNSLLVPGNAILRAQNAVLAVWSQGRLGRAHLLELSRALASDGSQLEFAAVGRLVGFVFILRARAVQDAAAED